MKQVTTLLAAVAVLSMANFALAGTPAQTTGWTSATLIKYANAQPGPVQAAPVPHAPIQAGPAHPHHTWQYSNEGVVASHYFGGYSFGCDCCATSCCEKSCGCSRKSRCPLLRRSSRGNSNCCGSCASCCSSWTSCGCGCSTVITHDHFGPIGPAAVPGPKVGPGGPVVPTGPVQAFGAPCAQCQHAHPWNNAAAGAPAPIHVAPGTPSPAQPRGELPLP